MSRRTPIRKVVRVERDAEEVAGQKAILRRLNANYAYDQAIDRSDNPAVP